MKLHKYSVGTGDRFAHQAKAQLQACLNALSSGIEVVPVWNKSNREHTIIGSEPLSARQAADAAVQALGWKLPYHVDADHITVATVDRFLSPCDFFTIDVADFIGQPAEPPTSMRSSNAILSCSVPFSSPVLILNSTSHPPICARRRKSSWTQ